MAIKHLKQRTDTHLSSIVKEAIKNGWSVQYIRKNFVNPKTNKPYSRYAIYYHTWRLGEGVSE